MGMSTTTTTVTPTVATTSGTTTVAQQCTYPTGTLATTSDKEMYFACLRDSCEDTSDATVSMLSGGDETSCSSAVMGGWACNTDISMTIIGVSGSTVSDMCPATCGSCTAESGATATVTATLTTSTNTMSSTTETIMTTATTTKSTSLDASAIVVGTLELSTETSSDLITKAGRDALAVAIARMAGVDVGHVQISVVVMGDDDRRLRRLRVAQTLAKTVIVHFGIGVPPG